MQKTQIANSSSTLLKLAFLTFIAMFTAGCSPTSMALSGGTAVGIAAAREGGLKASITDAAIRVQIHNLWFKHSIDMYRKLDMTVREGRVLITGTVPDPDMRVDAVRLAWQADGVREVINEINVDNGNGITGFVKDGLITGALKTKLIFDRDVQSINYSIDTVEKTVYLMGVAQNEYELNKVIDHARNIPGVENVVSYVRMRGEMPPVLEPLPEKSAAYDVPASPIAKPVEKQELSLE